MNNEKAFIINLPCNVAPEQKRTEKLNRLYKLQVLDRVADGAHDSNDLIKLTIFAPGIKRN